MKKYFPFVVLAILLSACTKQVEQSEIAALAQTAPIKPIHLTEAVTDVVLTDYVPTLSKYDVAYFNGEEVIGTAEELQLPASDALSCLTLQQDIDILSIAALPKKEHKQGLFAVDGNANTIRFAIDNAIGDVSLLIFWQNTFLAAPDLTQAEDGVYTLTIPQFSKRGRSFLRIYACDERYLYNDILIPLENMRPLTDTKQLNRHDNEAQVLYSLMIDRFQNGNPQNDWKMNSPEVLDIVDYQGGDLKGITQKISEGFFDKLGITTIWISPITQNPYDAWGYYEFKGEPCKYKNINGEQPAYTKFSGYHGYWPIYATQIDRRFGTEAELKEMLQTAHKHNLNVILDYVANHMHIASPTLQAHPDWHTDSILPDGRRNFELWDEARLTTWFDKHIPTLDLEREDVYQPMTDSALYWLANYDFDGFRHDACKHIPECYWRTLTHKMKTRFPQRSLWMIGETYGSPELIGSYIKTGMLDAQFDFNVYFTTVDALVTDEGSFAEVEKVIEESMAAYGAHHTMGNISGNHDQIRFISLAGGAINKGEDGKEAGWTREVGVGDSTVAYKKALLLEVLNLTIPGVPCIYQGDEYGQAGANDPDNRKMMRFDGYSEQEAAFREQVNDLITTRRHSLPLLYGDYRPIAAEKDLLCFERVYLGQRVLVMLNKSAEAQTLTVDNAEYTIEPYNYQIIQL